MAVITAETPSGAGPATRAVYETYRRDLGAHRRWRIVDRSVTVVLAAAVVLGLASIAVAALGLDLPLVVSVCPIGLLVAWLLWRQEILTLLGRRAEPVFPTQMLEIALGADEAARNPRPFGSLPVSMRTYRPEHR